MAHKFKITAAASEQFKFAFVYNAETIFWSENYKQKASAKSAVSSLCGGRALGTKTTFAYPLASATALATIKCPT